LLATKWAKRQDERAVKQPKRQEQAGRQDCDDAAHAVGHPFFCVQRLSVANFAVSRNLAWHLLFPF
jgi:hypothetical protein